MHEQKMADWKHLLAGGFAFMDAPFAVHPRDAERARKMVFAAMRKRISIDEIAQAAEEYLRERSWGSKPISEQVKAVRRFVKSVKPARRKKSAWLIMWEHMGDEEVNFSDKIIAIRDGRVNSERISEFIEQYYMASCYSLNEKMHYSSHQKDNPYSAQVCFDANGMPQLSGITCGHNPFIQARYVKNLELYEDEMGEPILTWDDPKALKGRVHAR